MVQLQTDVFGAFMWASGFACGALAAAIMYIITGA